MPGDYCSFLPHWGFPLLRRHKTRSTDFSFLEDTRASLVVAPSVVSLRVYSGERAVCFGSGFILECNQQFEATILTSGTLFRGDDLKPAKLGHIKESVRIGSPHDRDRDRAGLLLPGSRLIALGRYKDRIEDFIVASGEFRVASGAQ